MYFVSWRYSIIVKRHPIRMVESQSIVGVWWSFTIPRSRLPLSPRCSVWQTDGLSEVTTADDPELILVDACYLKV